MQLQIPVAGLVPAIHPEAAATAGRKRRGWAGTSPATGA